VTPTSVIIPRIELQTIAAMSLLDNPLPSLESGEGNEEVSLGELPRSRLVLGEIGMLGDGLSWFPGVDGYADEAVIAKG
jgi:hypothetical protein